MTSDLINALFEFGAALCLFRNVLQLCRDQEVRGVCPSTTIFFMIWGYWNIWFYPTNGFFLSFLAGLLVVVANTAWVALLIYFRFRKVETFQCEGCDRVMPLEYYGADPDGITLCPDCLAVCGLDQPEPLTKE